jgi:hypothetical protein
MPDNNEDFDVTVNANDHETDWSHLADSELHQIPTFKERVAESGRRRRLAVQQVFEDTKFENLSEAPRAYDKVLRRIDAVSMGQAMRGAGTHRFIAAPGGVVAFERKTGRAVGHLQWNRNDGGIDVMHVDNDSLNMGLTAMGLLKAGWEAARRTQTAGPTKTSSMSDYSFSMTSMLFPEYIQEEHGHRYERQRQVDPDTGRDFGYKISDTHNRNEQRRLANQGDYDRISNALRGSIPGASTDSGGISNDYNSFEFNAGRITGQGQRHSVIRNDESSEMTLRVDPHEGQSPQQVLQRSVANPTTRGWHVGTEEEYPNMATGNEHAGCTHCDGNSIIRLHPSLSEDELSSADDIRTDGDLRSQFENSGNTRTWTSEHHSDASVTLRDDQVGNAGILNLIRDGDDEDNVSDIFLSVPCAGRPAPRLRTRDF